MIHSGLATLAGTRGYFQRTKRSLTNVQDSHWFCKPQGIGLLVSRLGFGTYRLHRDQTEHHESLREALLTGCNVVDTAPNYSDGSAEILTGNVIHELEQAHRLQRDEVVLISKVGFIEESSLRLLQDRLPPETIEISPTLSHSIHPDFIEMQFEWSRERLNVDGIDVFLLQNPEVFLASPGAREAEYLRRIRNAFLHLEDLRARGLISFYGISSNALPSAEGCRILRNILSFAPPGFRVLQFPANPVETEYRKNGLLALARQQGLWTIGNRPLNAVSADGSSILRLARMVERPAEGENNTETRQIQMEEELQDLEGMMLGLVNEKEIRFAFREKCPSAADSLRHYRDRIPGPEGIYPLIHALTPPLQQTVTRLKTELERSMDAQRGKLLFERYLRLIHSTLASFPAYAAFQNDRRMRGLEEWGNQQIGTDTPLAIQAVQSVLAEGVDTVLVGMRRIAYVRQLQGVARLDSLRKIPDFPESLLPDRSRP